MIIIFWHFFRLCIKICFINWLFFNLLKFGIRYFDFEIDNVLTAS